MSRAKVDVALQRELTEGVPGAERTYRVSLELTERIEVPTGMSRADATAELERRVERSQRDVVEALRRLGVDELERLMLSNSLVVELDARQILEIARHPDVAEIRWVRPARVTTAPGEDLPR